MFVFRCSVKCGGIEFCLYLRKALKLSEKMKAFLCMFQKLHMKKSG